MVNPYYFTKGVNRETIEHLCAYIGYILINIEAFDFALEASNLNPFALNSHCFPLPFCNFKNSVFSGATK